MTQDKTTPTKPAANASGAACPVAKLNGWPPFLFPERILRKVRTQSPRFQREKGSRNRKPKLDKKLSSVWQAPLTFSHRDDIQEYVLRTQTQQPKENQDHV